MKTLGFAIVALLFYGCQTSFDGSTSREQEVRAPSPGSNGKPPLIIPLPGHLRDDEPLWTVNRDNALADGIVIDAANNGVMADQGHPDPQKEGSHPTSRLPTATVRLENNLEVLAINRAGMDLVPEDRVIVRIFETPKGTRRHYDIIKVLNSQ